MKKRRKMDVEDQSRGTKKLKPEIGYSPDSNPAMKPTTTVPFSPNNNTNYGPVPTALFDPRSFASLNTIQTEPNASQKNFERNISAPMEIPVGFYHGDPPDTRYQPIFSLNSSENCLALLNYRLMKYCVENPDKSDYNTMFGLIELIGVKRNTDESRYQRQSPYFMDNQNTLKVIKRGGTNIVMKNVSYTYAGTCQTKNFWPGDHITGKNLGFLLVKKDCFPKSFKFDTNMHIKHDFVKPESNEKRFVWQLIPMALPRDFNLSDIKDQIPERQMLKFDFESDLAFFRLGLNKNTIQNGISGVDSDVSLAGKSPLITINVLLETYPSIAIPRN